MPTTNLPKPPAAWMVPRMKSSTIVMMPEKKETMPSTAPRTTSKMVWMIEAKRLKTDLKRSPMDWTMEAMAVVWR